MNHKRIAQLLTAMKAASEPVKPKLLGFIGEDHLRARFEADGGRPETFKYDRTLDVISGVPRVIEFAFGVHPGAFRWDHTFVRRRKIVGVNWSAADFENDHF